MPDKAGSERIVPTPSVTYVTAGRIGCRGLLDQIHLMTMRGADPGVVLDEIRVLIEQWRANV